MDDTVDMPIDTFWLLLASVDAKEFCSFTIFDFIILNLINTDLMVRK